VVQIVEGGAEAEPKRVEAPAASTTAATI